MVHIISLSEQVPKQEKHTAYLHATGAKAKSVEKNAEKHPTTQLQTYHSQLNDQFPWPPSKRDQLHGPQRGHWSWCHTTEPKLTIDGARPALPLHFLCGTRLHLPRLLKAGLRAKLASLHLFAAVETCQDDCATATIHMTPLDTLREPHEAPAYPLIVHCVLELAA